MRLGGGISNFRFNSFTGEVLTVEDVDSLRLGGGIKRLPGLIDSLAP